MDFLFESGAVAAKCAGAGKIRPLIAVQIGREPGTQRGRGLGGCGGPGKRAGENNHSPEGTNRGGHNPAEFTQATHSVMDSLYLPWDAGVRIGSMRRVWILFMAAISVFAADDPWAKVKELKSGVEVRVFKKNAAQPVTAKMDELTAENLLVVVKNEQVAIPRDQIERIDARPAQTKSRVTTKTESKTTNPDTSPAPPGYHSQTPGSTSSSTVSVGSKPDFETVYRRAGTAASHK